MDSPTFLFGEDEPFFHDRPGIPGSYSRTVRDLDLKHVSKALQYRRDSDDELASALLNDTTTMEQQATYDSKTVSATRVHDSHATKHTRPFNPNTANRSSGHVARNAISRANMNAFQANRLQAPPVPSFPNRPSTAVQPKTTSRQRKGTVRSRRPSRGNSGFGPQQIVDRPSREILDRSDLPQTKGRQSSTIPLQRGTEQMKPPRSQAASSLNELPDDRGKSKRKSESILALTDATKFNPQDIMAVRRSKTIRESAKTSDSNKKGVLKKMTDALTDRLHLTHKLTEVEAHEADQVRGSGFYDYETNQFIKDVVADIPTHRRQLPSRLAEIYERGRSGQGAQEISDDSLEWISGTKNTEALDSEKSSDDPFADPDCAKQITTDFVNRLKAATPPQATRDPTPMTPSASPTNLETLLRGSVNSLLPFPPVGASTPRIVVSRRHSHALEGPRDQSRDVARVSASIIALSPDLDALDLESDGSSEEDSDDDMPSTGHYLAPVQGYTYQPVLNAPDRKKHPSPNKIDLELLETRLRERWPETLAQATEKAKKHPSPLKVDIEALGEQFRKAYPDLLGGNTPNHSEKSDGSYCVMNTNEETDELLLSFVTTTPDKRPVSRHRKASSVSCSNQVAALEMRNKRKTIAMLKYAGHLNTAPHLQLACPAYHQA